MALPNMDKMTDETENDICPICMDEPQPPKTLDICKHTFCHPCIDESFSKLHPKCPVCGVVYGELRGTQPDGEMSVEYSSMNIPGYEGCGAIEINYYFPSGIQNERHPNPGQRYSGTGRRAFLPNNAEGKKVLGLLRRAFDARLLFTVGRSATTGVENTTIWNDVHHKTAVSGGSCNFGYPDSTYLNRVQQELAAHGIK